MKLKAKTIIIMSTMLFMAFKPAGKGLKVEYYHNLKFKKQAHSPTMVKMIDINNMSRSKSIAVQGILFTYKNRKAESVNIAGNFSNWETTAMTRSDNGVWYYFLDAGIPEKNIKYKFQVDSIWTIDPKNFNRDYDGIGSYVSITYNMQNKDMSQITYRIIGNDLVEFRIYRPGAKFISVVGDFNNWNPENDILRKGNDGVWSLKKRLTTGEYLYKYVIDGKWVPDIYNKNSGSDIAGDLCSILAIQ